MKNRNLYWRRYKIQELLYIGQWHLSPLQIRHLGTSHSSPNLHQLTLNLNNSMQSLPFQRWFWFWKEPEVTGCQIWVVGDWVTWVIWCFPKRLWIRHDTRAGMLSWWSCHSPVAHSCGLLNRPTSFSGRMFKLNAKCDADSFLYLLSHFKCNSHTVHTLTQWCLAPPMTSTVKSSLFMHVCSSSLSLAASLHRCQANRSHYINNGWTFMGRLICIVLVFIHIPGLNMALKYTLTFFSQYCLLFCSFKTYRIAKPQNLCTSCNVEV